MQHMKEVVVQRGVHVVCVCVCCVHVRVVSIYVCVVCVFVYVRACVHDRKKWEGRKKKTTRGKSHVLSSSEIVTNEIFFSVDEKSRFYFQRKMMKIPGQFDQHILMRI